MSRYNVVYAEDGTYEIESLTDAREVKLFVEDWDITEYSVIVGKLMLPADDAAEFEEADEDEEFELDEDDAVE